MPTKTTDTVSVPEDVIGRPRRMPVGGVSWRHTFRALRHRNYRLFFWGQLVSLIGTWMQQTAMSWFVYEITNSKFLLGMGWINRRSLPEALDSYRDANRADDLRVSARAWSLGGIRQRDVHCRNR